MSCIVGVAQNGEVWMGGDSALTCGDSLTRRKEPKVFRKFFPTDQTSANQTSAACTMLIGCAGSVRVLQLAQYELELPARNDEISPMKYLVSHFVPAWRECLKQHGAMGESKNTEEAAAQSVFLIGFRGGIFYLDCDFNIYEPEWGFDASGSGCEVAMGALHATQKMLPEFRVRAALGAAADCIQSVCAPFHVEKL
jgi:ATP-dependent protease HslVU (ClpYQ) peptidase subunit